MQRQEFFEIEGTVVTTPRNSTARNSTATELNCLELNCLELNCQMRKYP
jgi:hypothetical protein